jgi:sucrose phosphorylase
MVYNFALPPLVLHAFYRGNATTLSAWAEGMAPPSERTHFFNILETHDGVGLMGVKDILSPEEIDFLIRSAQNQGALISYKMTEDFTESPYEINTTWWSALNRDDGEEALLLQVRRYLASRSIALALRGVPGIYVHGLVGTSNDLELAGKTGVKRDVNRSELDSRVLAEAAKDPDSRFSLLQLYGSRLYRMRTEEAAFHPQGEQRVLAISPRIFSVLRTSPKGDQHILALTNVTEAVQTVEIPLRDLPVDARHWYDLVGKRIFYAKDGILKFSLEPYEVLWLKPSRG